MMPPAVGLGVGPYPRLMGPHAVPSAPIGEGDVTLDVLDLDAARLVLGLLLGDLLDGRPVDAIRPFLGVALGLVASLELPFRGL
ncbi:MAG TPA: hypothetical protein VN819_03670 [Thermoplasmata archaeon]|nr:hypothetical protein [Thermoplasmata archaeon]